MVGWDMLKGVSILRLCPNLLRFNLYFYATLLVLTVSIDTRPLRRNPRRRRSGYSTQTSDGAIKGTRTVDIALLSLHVSLFSASTKVPSFSPSRSVYLIPLTNLRIKSSPPPPPPPPPTIFTQLH